MQNAITELFWQILLRVSWQAAVLILVMLGLQWALGGRLTPRARSALWLLVVIRLAVPWSVPSALSPFNHFKVTGAILAMSGSRPAAQSEEITPSATALTETPAEPRMITAGVQSSRETFWWIPVAWGAGVLALGLYLLMTHYRLWRRVAFCRPLVDSDVLKLLEDCKQLMSVHVPVSVVETAAVDAPCLFGFLRPRLLLPDGFTRRFSLEELRHIFLHELGHIRRKDIPLGWLMAVLQVLHWFNPLVWLAFSRIRATRELACDELALSHAGAAGSKPYGRTIVKLLESFGDSFRLPSVAGIAEDRKEMKERIAMIAKYQKTNRGMGLAGVLFIGLALISFTEAQTAAPGKAPPSIVKCTPENGSANVDPDAVTEISVTFNQDMGGGMSWTGGGPSFPPGREGAKAHWVDKRTCILPVKLEAGHYYRVGINSQSYRNFRSTSGVSAIPTAITFTTTGAGADAMKQMEPPVIVSTSPVIGTNDVDPGISEITVTFDRDMGKGMSWTGGGADFPAAPPGQKAHWLDARTCVLPVQLEAAHYYRVGINSKSYRNFASADGVAAMPSAIYFTTQGAGEELQAKTRLPQVTEFAPANGAKDVSASLEEVRVTFSVPMGGGFSWCTAGDDDHDFPPGRQGKSARWTDDHKTCVLPVNLKPGMTYRISLNAPGYNNFQSAGGVPLAPVSYTFKTSEGR